MPSLTLFYFPACPFCARVLTYMKSRGIKIPMKNIWEDPAHREELINIGGRSQVPCLVVEGQALYESDDIIQWFEKNWGDQQNDKKSN